ncbi:class I SAM-dependent methyltransferase [Candidatus Peregrinibacteria bacterium]|nr:class I SAM-dependent methyltransferase [Candidatus Peregrinibacteria bacterium]
MIVLQPDRILLRRQVCALAPKLSGDILDVGGAGGNRYRHMFTHAKSLRSLDINPNLHPDIVGSAEEIPLPDASFDGVICTQMLEHVPHPWKALAEMHRILRPGGKVLLTVPQWNELHEEPRDYYRYTNFGLKVLCEEAGFAIEEIHQRGKYHSFMVQCRNRRWIDLLHPYQNFLAMLILSPLSYVCSHAGIWLDGLDSSLSAQKHVIGWAVLLRKDR